MSVQSRAGGIPFFSGDEPVGRQDDGRHCAFAGNGTQIELPPVCVDKQPTDSQSDIALGIGANRRKAGAGRPQDRVDLIGRENRSGIEHGEDERSIDIDTRGDLDGGATWRELDGIFD